MSTITKLTILSDGPIHCAGSFELEGETKDEAYLCRCGQSKNKPYCDGAHNGILSDAGEVVREDAEVEAGSLTVTLLKDGPILLKGPHAIVSGDGATTSHGTKGALCRCGLSASKPFCDGAHKDGGFTA